MKIKLILINLILIPWKIMSRKSIFSFIYKSKIDKNVALLSGSKIYWSKIDKNSYVGNKTRVFQSDIGKYCSIGENCIIGAPEHDLGLISTSPIFYGGKNILKKNYTDFYYNPYKKNVEIKNDVWIGANCLIKRGITIGNGAVIGMGAVLTHNVDDYEIWAGNPARKIGIRFEKGNVELAQLTKWWQLEEAELIEIIDNNPKMISFLNNFNKNKRGQL